MNKKLLTLLSTSFLALAASGCGSGNGQGFPAGSLAPLSTTDRAQFVEVVQGIRRATDSTEDLKPKTGADPQKAEVASTKKSDPAKEKMVAELTNAKCDVQVTPSSASQPNPELAPVDTKFSFTIGGKTCPIEYLEELTNHSTVQPQGSTTPIESSSTSRTSYKVRNPESVFGAMNDITAIDVSTNGQARSTPKTGQSQDTDVVKGTATSRKYGLITVNGTRQSTSSFIISVNGQSNRGGMTTVEIATIKFGQVTAQVRTERTTQGGADGAASPEKVTAYLNGVKLTDAEYSEIIGERTAP